MLDLERAPLAQEVAQEAELLVAVAREAGPPGLLERAVDLVDQPARLRRQLYQDAAAILRVAEPAGQVVCENATLNQRVVGSSPTRLTPGPSSQL